MDRRPSSGRINTMFEFVPCTTEQPGCLSGSVGRCVATWTIALAALLTQACTSSPHQLPQTAARPGAVGTLVQSEDEPDDNLDERQRRQIDLIGPILLDADDGPDDGRLLAAAQELLALQVAPADRVLEQALRSNQPAQMLAVLRALISETTVPPRLIDAAVDILPTVAAPVQDTLWRMLAQHEVDVISDVAALATNQSLPQDQRLNAIGALGAFRTRDAADLLINMLDESRQEPAAVTAGICDALTRLTRLPYGNRPDTWRAWWVQARNQSREQWLVDQVQRLATERAELERELTLQRQRLRRIEQRVVDVLRELFRALPSDVEQQLAPLPTLLDDELSVVREFAIERIRFISRDHEIPHEIENALARRLDDDDAGIRARAAQLLHELNHDGLSALLATRLADETSFNVMATYIDLLSKRPTPDALPALITRVGDPSLCDQACQAIWNIVDQFGNDALDEELSAALRQYVADALAGRSSPALVRLEVYLISDPADASSQLEHEQAAVRTAVAEALAKRSILDPLRERASDPAVYPVMVRAVAAGDGSLDTLQSLIDLKPPTEPTVAAWQESLSRVIARLAPTDLLEADERLRRGNGAASHRIELLSRAVSIPAEQLPNDQRAELAVRLGQLRLERREYLKAHQELELIAVNNDSPMLKDLKFHAAALSGHFSRAIELQPTADAWIDLFASLAGRDETLARRVQAEIDQRFASTLDGELKSRYESLRQQLTSDESEQAPAPADDGSNTPPA